MINFSIQKDLPEGKKTPVILIVSANMSKPQRHSFESVTDCLEHVKNVFAIALQTQLFNIKETLTSIKTEYPEYACECRELIYMLLENGLQLSLCAKHEILPTIAKQSVAALNAVSKTEVRHNLQIRKCYDNISALLQRINEENLLNA